jgi:hypothetical protein
MSLGRRVCGLVLGALAFAFGTPASAEPPANCPAVPGHPADGPFAGFAVTLAQAPCAEPSLPPATIAPMPSKPRSEAAPPGGVPVVADFHLAATALGFEQSIGPAVGRAVAYQGQEYLVVEVAAIGGGPTFSGGSRFVIATTGGALEIGLKALDERERQVAAALVR